MRGCGPAYGISSAPEAGGLAGPRPPVHQVMRLCAGKAAADEVLKRKKDRISPRFSPILVMQGQAGSRASRVSEAGNKKGTLPL